MNTTNNFTDGNDDFVKTNLLPTIDVLTSANLEKFKKERELTDLKEQKRSTIEKLKKIKEINSRNQMEMNTQRILENDLLMKQELLKNQVENVDGMEKEIMLLKDKDGKLQEKINELKTKKSQLQRELNVKDIDRESKKTRLIETNDINIKNYQRKQTQRCDTITAKMTDRRKTNADILTQIHTLNESISQIKNKFNLLNEERNDSLRQIENIKHQIANKTNEFEDKKRITETENMKSKSELDNLNEKIHKQKQSKSQIKLDHQDKKKLLTSRTQELIDINNKIRIKSDILLSINNDINKNKADISILDSKFTNLLTHKSKVETEVNQLESQLQDATHELAQSEKALGKLKLELSDLINQIHNQQILNDQVPDPRIGQSLQLPYQQISQPIYPYTTALPPQPRPNSNTRHRHRHGHGHTRSPRLDGNTDHIAEGLNFIPLSKKVTIEQYQPVRRCSEFTHFLNVVYPISTTREPLKAEPDDKMLSQYLDWFTSNPNYIITNIKDEYSQTEPFNLIPA